jgi:nucleoside-diphosphate-sugar epimerase
VSRVLLTGAGGFIGRAALASLGRAGHEVHAVSSRPRGDVGAAEWHVADLLAEDAAARVVQAVRPDLLLHLAWYAEHGLFWTSPENERWAEATLRLVRAFGDHGGRRAVLAGTCAEYAWGGDAVYSEATTPLRPATLYGASKDATRVAATALADEAGFELAWGRVFFLYGPGEAEERLVPSVIRALLAGGPAQVTEGRQVRDFLHVSDVGAAFVALLDSTVQGPVNIGSGRGVAVRDLVELIGATIGRLELIEYGAVPMALNDPPSLVADVGRLRDEVRFEPRFDLPAGIRDTVAWWEHR